MASYGKKFLDKILNAESSPIRLARSVSLGNFIAFSPFLGIQTLLIFGLGKLLRLNITVIFTVVYVVNNPWTMIPIAALDYSIGHWLTETVFKLDLMRYNPSWMAWVNNKIGYYLVQYLGIAELCFWCFIIGGMVVASVISLASYPFMKIFFTKLIRQRNRENT